MKKGKFVKELERIIDMVKAEDDGFEYGGKVVSIKKMMIAMKSGQRALRWL